MQDVESLQEVFKQPTAVDQLICRDDDVVLSSKWARASRSLFCSVFFFFLFRFAYYCDQTLLLKEPQEKEKK